MTVDEVMRKYRSQGVICMTGSLLLAYADLKEAAKKVDEVLKKMKEKENGKQNCIKHCILSRKRCY